MFVHVFFAPHIIISLPWPSRESGENFVQRFTNDSHCTYGVTYLYQEKLYLLELCQVNDSGMNLQKSNIC